MRRSTFFLSAALVCSAALFGGASQESPLRLAVVELSALPLAFVALRQLALTPALVVQHRPILILLGLMILLPLGQLVALPTELWSHLPGQAARVEALRLAQVAPQWLPISLAPAATAACGLALIPPAAMFCGALCLSPEQHRRLIILWLITAVAGLCLGLAQIAAPSGGPAYLYSTTNLGSLVGLFANRNHEATFLLALAPFAAAMSNLPAAAGGGAGGAGALRRWLAAAFILISVVALGVIRSRAGLALAVPAVVGATLVLWRGRRAPDDGRPAARVAAAAMLATAAVLAFGLPPILDRFAPQTAEEVRFQRWPFVAVATRDFLPLGAGLGSFDGVFRAVEPLNLVRPTYFNHAHNDYLELALETGFVGAGMLAAFCVWLGRATLLAWREKGSSPRAASLAVLLMMGSSIVDYPLRSETLAVLFAFSCGVLARTAHSRRAPDGEAKQSR